MKKRISGKTYNTETAKFIQMMDDTEYKVLYMTKTGDYFIYSVDDSGENITPYSEDDGWIMEVFTDNITGNYKTYEEWKTHKLALEKVRDYVQNNLNHPFNSKLKVKRNDQELVFSDDNITIRISLCNDCVTFCGVFSKEEYELSYELLARQEVITSMYYNEIGYVEDEDGALFKRECSV